MTERVAPFMILQCASYATVALPLLVYRSGVLGARLQRPAKAFMWVTLPLFYIMIQVLSLAVLLGS